MADEIDPKNPTRSFLVFVAGTVTGLVIVAALSAGAAALVNEARTEERVHALETSSKEAAAATSAVPTQLVRLETKVDQLTSDVARLNTKLDERGHQR